MDGKSVVIRLPVNSGEVVDFALDKDLLVWEQVRVGCSEVEQLNAVLL